MFTTGNEDREKCWGATIDCCSRGRAVVPLQQRSLANPLWAVRVRAMARAASTLLASIAALVNMLGIGDAVGETVRPAMMGGADGEAAGTT